MRRPPGLLTPGLVALALLGAATAAAQPAAVRGRVVDAEGGQGLGGAVVRLTPLGAAAAGDPAAGDGAAVPTDAGGFFRVPGLAPGRYALAVLYVGYRPFADTLALAPGDRRVVGVALRPLPTDLTELVVEALRPVEAGGARLDPAAARGLPGLAPGGDLGALLTADPSVVSLADEGGGLYVRGGEPVHHVLLLDGIPMLQPVHALGEGLAVPPEAVAYLDVFPSGAPARLGGRLGAFLDVGLRPGSKRRFAASAAGGLTGAAAHAEGPLLPGKASFLAAARGTAFGAVGPAGGARRYRYGDGTLRLSVDLTRLASLDATAFATADEAAAPASSGAAGAAPRRLRYANRGAGVRFAFLPETAPVRTDVHLYAAAFDAEVDGPTRRASHVRQGGAQASFRYLLGPNDVHLGLFASSHRFSGEAGDRFAEYVTEGGAFAEGTLALGALRATAGLRVQSFPSRGRPSVEPRARAAWTRGRHAASVTAAVQGQEVAGGTVLPGAADLFVAWRLTAPNAPLPTARNGEARWAGPLGPGLRGQTAVYGRAVEGLGADGATKARVAGADAVLDAARGPVGLRLAYGYARVRYRAAGGGPFAPAHDRPHRADALVRVGRGALRLDGRVRYGAGAPYRRVVGFYDAPAGPPFDPAGPGSPVVVLGDATRLPAYARVDAALAYARTFGGWAVEAQAGVLNALGRRNVFYVDPALLDRVDGPGRTPVVALRLRSR